MIINNYLARYGENNENKDPKTYQIQPPKTPSGIIICRSLIRIAAGAAARAAAASALVLLVLLRLLVSVAFVSNRATACIRKNSLLHLVL